MGSNTNKTPGKRRLTCPHCGLLGHRACSRAGEVQDAARVYDRIGIEIEGFWDRTEEEIKSLAREVTGTPGCHDGSLDDGPDEYVDWEIQTRPGTLGEALSQLARAYPDYVNRTCGMHVHLSFPDAGTATLLASPAFGDRFRGELKTWGRRMSIPERHTFWERIRGENDYCQSGEPDSEGLIGDRFDRYQMINLHSWTDKSRRTIEFRVLPMFRDLAVAQSAVAEIVAIVDRYVHEYSERHVASGPTLREAADPQHAIRIPAWATPADDPNDEIQVSREVSEDRTEPTDINGAHSTIRVTGPDHVLHVSPTSRPVPAILPEVRAAGPEFDRAIGTYAPVEGSIPAHRMGNGSQLVAHVGNVYRRAAR